MVNQAQEVVCAMKQIAWKALNSQRDLSQVMAKHEVVTSGQVNEDFHITGQAVGKYENS